MPTGLRVRYQEAGKSKWKSRLIDLLRSAGFATQAFASAEEFISLAHREDTLCHPRRDFAGERALKGGAVDLLRKPVRREALLNAVHVALQQNSP